MNPAPSKYFNILYISFKRRVHNNFMKIDLLNRIEEGAG